ncbi:DUF221-domain-containing protein [Delitschia confertaspora ATCC 74209]|uniref:DUF221-domain-containing protein n=1 Tax=Delitschia confertaspora ATCC 74209 TaxID=1513339 RepID=A0A9P4MU19_9PLEO|nr:DUF221-domain-containing protein [Delitschia confertaspora ATCC 74209]
MSNNSSNGRPPESPGPSSISSHTLTSRYSGAYGDKGEGSSSQQSSPAKPQDHIKRGVNIGDDYAESSTTARSNGSLDVPSARQRNRRPGGFLLDSTIPTGPRSRHPSHEPPGGPDTKGKRAVWNRHGQDATGYAGRIREANSGSSLGSPLSKEVITAQDNGREKAGSSSDGRLSPYREIRVRKSRNSTNESASMGLDGWPESDHATPPRTVIDPNQIIHMALNLSESRRRNLSAGQLLVPPPGSSSKRVTSAGIPPAGSYANYGAGSSLRQYLNEQRRTSRNISPTPGRSPLSASRQMSASFARSGSMALPGQERFEISDATLARRDKARAYIELKLEYLRLLESLPPLKPDSTAPGNFIVSTNNIPGSTHAQLTRIPSYTNSRYQLGRAYNPLQFIRNRRLRARERKSWEHEPEEFEDVEHVRRWVDKVEAESRHPMYRRQDGVELPKFHADHEVQRLPSQPSRLRMGWVVTPPELLADAYWLEQDSHKTIIEDQFGRKVFPARSQLQQDTLQPRDSKEYPEKRRKSWIDAVPRSSLDVPTGDESEAFSDRGRKRRLLPGFRHDSPRRHKKSGWRKPGYSSSSSDSESGSHGLKARKSRRETDVNTGPLKLQMKEMMEKEAREAELGSPGPISPDTPDKWGGGYPSIPGAQPEPEIIKRKTEESEANGGIWSTQERKPHHDRRTNLVLSPSVISEPRSSFEDLDSSAPNSPLHRKFFPHIGADLSPPSSRATSGNRKSRKSKLDIFRSEESSKGTRSEPNSASSEKKRNSPQTGEDINESGGRGTAILSAPGAVKSLLKHTKNESVSGLHSPDQVSRREAGDTKDPSSAVSRFFKGVRHEGSKVGEFIFRKERPPEDPCSDSDSDLSIPSGNDSGTDEESSERKRRRLRPKPSRNVTATTTGSNGSKGRYHLDLPSFRSSNVNQDYVSDQDFISDSQALEDPIPRQARARANSRSQRFDKLAPPAMDMRSISGSSAASSRSTSPFEGNRRINAVLERSGGVGQGGLPITSLARNKLGDSSERHRSSSRPKLGKRHWSITDDTGSSLRLQTATVSRHDIARVRALLLCSGVKAREISRRAQNQRAGGPSPFLLRAAKVANASLIPVSKKEEHVLAARILVRYLEASTQAVHISADEFREHTVKELMSRISEIKSHVETELFPRVRKEGDEAVRISSDVAGSAPLAVKEISDGVDTMIRMRRRRTRWLKRPKGGSSLASLVSAFVPTWATAVLFVVIFVAIRSRYRNIYAPRTYMGTIPEKDRTPSTSRSYFAWFHTMRKVPDKFLLYHGSLDSYLYLRFLRTIIFVCVIGSLLTWTILIPVNATGGGTSLELEKITIGNVSKTKYLYAHAVVACLFFTFIMFLVARERLWLIGLRQAWNLSKPNAQRLSSRTVLFLSAPKDSLKEQNMHRYFGEDAVRIWPVTKADVLRSMVSARDAAVKQLEAAETTLICNANKKEARKKASSLNHREPRYESLPATYGKSLRPTHRPKITLAEDKVDSIEFYRKQIKEKDADIENVRKNYELPDSHGAAAVFVEFKTQSTAQRAYQQLTSSELLALSPRYIGVVPKEVIWENLTIAPAKRLSRKYLAHALVALTTLFWSFPIAFVGAISNVSYLAENVKWLAFLQDLPQPFLGLLTGLVPPLATSALTTYVPIIFRYIAQKCGEPTNTSTEIKVQKWYYVFQVTQVFLVTTLSSGAAAVASQIAKDPISVPDLLAQRLPSASNFYLNYFIVQGFTSASDLMLNYSDLLSYLAFDKLLDTTPRQKYNRYTSMKSLQWGKQYPKFTNFAIIAIAYSCIAPLVLGFAAGGLSLYYFSYRYNLLFVMAPKIDTRGHSYTLALQQLLTGVYIAELALLGIFSLHGATGPFVITAVLLAATILYNYIMNRYFSPFEEYLPADLIRQVEEDDEQTALLSSVEAGDAENHIQRLSSRSRLPPSIVNPITRFFEPHLFASTTVMTKWLKDGDWDEDDVPEYTEEELKRAYANPVFTSSAPTVWLPRDPMGVSQNEVKENGEEGIKASDEGAWLGRDGKVGWDVEDFGSVPVFRMEVRY